MPAVAATPEHQQENRLEDTVEKIRAYNQRAIETGKHVTDRVIGSYEKTALSVADFQEKAAGATKVKWLAAVTSTQSGLTRDLATAYTSAARRLLH